jgi:hypothetical protein
VTTPHYDLVVPSGTTLGVAVRYHQPGARVRADALVAGAWVYYCGAPWPVYSVALDGATVHLRLGLGLWWEPDVTLRADMETVRADPVPWASVIAVYHDEYGRAAEVPTELSGDALTLMLVPHSDEAAQWSTDMAERITADVANLDPSPDPATYVQQRPRLTYAWSLVGTFDGLTAPRSVLQGTLVITPTTSALALVP